MDTLTETPEMLAEDFVENRFGDRYLYSINREGFNTIGSAGVFEEYFGAKLFNKHTLYVVIGTDSGLLIRHILNKGLPEGSRYLFIELAHVIERLESAGLLEEAGERIACVPYAQWQASAIEFKITEYFYIQGVELLKSIAAEDAALDEYVELFWEVEETLTRDNWEIDASLGHKHFISPLLRNVAENVQSATPLRGAFAGRTAALLAGGPSLDESLPWLLANRERLVILALFRISKRLQQVGLTPDFVFGSDPQEICFDIGREMFNFPEHVVFIHTNFVAPILLGQWDGPSLYIGDLVPWKSPLNGTSLPHVGPTVTNTALAIGQAMGFSRIILAGVDMCFSREGFSHAQGTLERQAGPRFDVGALRVETNGGWYANTGPDYACALKILTEQAEYITGSGTELINPSPNSARIPHVLHQSLETLQLPHEPIDAARVVLSRVRMPDEARRQKHCRALSLELSKALHHANAIESLATEALECNARMYGDGGALKDIPAKRRMDEIEKELNRKHRVYSPLIMTVGIREFLKATRPFDTDEMDAERAREAGEIYYKAYRDGAERLRDLLQDALDRVAARLSELAERPDWDAILDQWRRDKHYRRAWIWRTRHADAYERLAPEVRHALDNLEQQHRDALTEQMSSFAHRVKQRGTLATAQSRARILLKNHQIDELRKLLEGLALYPESEEALPYRRLVEGYLAELAGDHKTALLAYLDIIEGQTQPLFEDALLRVAHISLETGDSGNAISALECLSHLSAIYQPQYAELLKLTGNPLAAIDTYNAFLERFPNNIYVQLRLARLYQDINVPEGARLLLNHILEKHPENEAARKMLAALAST